VRGPSGEPYENTTIHRLDVWLNRSDGRLLKIISAFPADMDASARPTGGQRGQGMNARFEGYDGVPAQMPRVNFMQALQSAEEGLGGTTVAKQIESLYVLLRQTVSKRIAPVAPCRESPCPRWAITLRYLPVIRHAPPGDYQREALPHPPTGIRFENIRHYIDPATGEWLGAGNVP